MPQEFAAILDRVDQYEWSHGEVLWRGHGKTLVAISKYGARAGDVADVRLFSDDTVAICASETEAQSLGMKAKDAHGSYEQSNKDAWERRKSRIGALRSDTKPGGV